MPNSHRKPMTMTRLPDTKLGLKGRGLHDWLTEQCVTAPAGMFEIQRTGDGALIVRYGADEIVVASPPGSTLVASLSAALPATAVYKMPREDSTFALEGAGAFDLLSQTCGVQFSTAAADNAIFTRVAGVSCAVLPIPDAAEPQFLLWVDPSYVDYLWEALEKIVADLGGVTRAQEPSLAAAAH